MKTAFKNNILKYIFFSLLLFNISFSQDVKNNKIVKEDQFFNELKTRSNSTTENSSSFNHVKNLIYNIQDAVYVSDNAIKSYGLKPTNLYTNLSDFNLLDSDQINRNNIEIIIIKIDEEKELKTNVDITNLSLYKNLKYLYIVSTITVNELDINKLFKEAIGNYKVFYRYDNGDLR